jgi:5-methyltetrahydrofolate--homocysteine methyltransferase
MSKFKTLLDDRGFLLIDGATGTNYFAAGLETGYPPELWNVEKPDLVKDLHARFLEAGSDLILSNSFGGTGFRLKLHQAQDRATELNQAAARLAREAAQEHFDDTGHDVAVAGSMGPTGELFEPLGALTYKSAYDGFKQQADALAEGGVDILWIETLSSLEEVDAAFDAASSTGLPVCVTMTFDTAGKSMMGVAPAVYAEHVAEKGAAAFGANCGVGPAELMHSMMEMRDAFNDSNPALVAKGNCGIPEYLDGNIHYHGTPELMASYAVLARDAGMKVIGGCCGTTPEHIAAMRKALDDTPQGGDVTIEQLNAALGEAWAGLGADGDQNSQNTGGRSRSRRRRR